MKKTNSLISIVVPCYKSEEYIERCLNSLLEQDYNNIEIVVVNDGSPDDSLKKVKSFKDSRIVIIDKKNEGAWKARLDGIKKAKGEYITFVDSDDYVTKDFVSKLYNSIIENNSDISVCGFDRISSHTNKVLCNEMIAFDDTIDIYKNIDRVPLINTSNWNKLFKKELFKDVLDYKVNSRLCEDLVLNMFAYFNAKTISFIPEVLYHYYVNDNSVVNTLNANDIESIEETFINLRKSSPEGLLPCIDFMAIIHLGFSLTSRIYQSKDKNRRKLIKGIVNNIRTNYPLYNKFKANGFKLKIIKLVFKLHLVYAFVAFYSFVINTLKIDIKW